MGGRFEQGHAKVGGRAAGTPNKRTRFNVAEELEKHGVDLVKEIVARLPQLDVREQVKTLMALLPYTAARPTWCEPGADDEQQGESRTLVAQLPTEFLIEMLQRQQKAG